MRTWLAAILLVVCFGCYEPPSLPKPVAMEPTALKIWILPPPMPDPNNPYYIEEWDNPYHRRPWPLDGYRYLRKLTAHPGG